MKSLSGTYNVMFEGESIGEAYVNDDGIRVKFDMQCKIVDEKIYRLYCIQGRAAAPIGIAVPERGRLRLKKTVSKKELTYRGITEIDGFELRAASSVPSAEKQMKESSDGVWRRITDASHLFEDKDIAEACRNLPSALAMKSGGAEYLAISASPEQPFPMMPVFCFGEERYINGRSYIVFKIKNGKLQAETDGDI